MGGCSSSSPQHTSRHVVDCPEFETALEDMVNLKSYFTSVALYARGDLELPFAPHCGCEDIPTRLNNSIPDAGIIFKSSNMTYLLEMTNDSGLVYQRAQSYRFSVPRFRVVCILKGRIDPSEALQYLSGSLKMKVFALDGSLRHHDFAVSFFDHLRLHSDPNTTRLVIHANDHAEPRDFMEIPQSPS